MPRSSQQPPLGKATSRALDELERNFVDRTHLLLLLLIVILVFSESCEASYVVGATQIPGAFGLEQGRDTSLVLPVPRSAHSLRKERFLGICLPPCGNCLPWNTRRSRRPPYPAGSARLSLLYPESLPGFSQKYRNTLISHACLSELLAERVTEQIRHLCDKLERLP